jgi:hypothetical protein
MYLCRMKRPVGRPKAYVEQVSFLAEEGTKAHVEIARGEQAKADFYRDALSAHVKRGLKRREAVERELARREKGEGE